MTNLASQFLRHATDTNRARIRVAILGTVDYTSLHCEGCGKNTRHTLNRGPRWTTITCDGCGHSNDWKADTR